MNKVAVVIVCTNQAEFLSDTFDSLEKQTYQNFDIIFYNNACTDNSMEVVFNYYNEKNQRRILFESYPDNVLLPIGITRWFAVQAGIQREYEYIALLDADDMWNEDKLEKQMRVFEENLDIKMVFSDCKYFNHETQEVYPQYTFFDKHKPYDKDFFWKLLTKRNFMPCCTLMFEAKSLGKVIGNPEAYTSAEDYDWVLKMANKFGVGYVNEPLAYYRVHSNQVSRNKARCLAEEIDVVKRACKFRLLTQRQKERVYMHLLWLYIKLLVREFQGAETYIRGED